MNRDAHSKRIVVTGVNGFVGKHLVRELSGNGTMIIGVGREPGPAAEIAELLDTYLVADLSAGWPVSEAVDAVIHLAGLAAVGPSFDAPQDYINLNSAMVTHMCEFYLRQTQKPRILVVSSGAVYDSDQSMPLTEGASIALNSPYVVSKILVENQCAYYRKRGLDCILARPFNHIGPGQLPGFLVPDIIEQLKDGDEIHVGNITTKRDYTDVRDVVRAYRLLATSPRLQSSTYNICSGQSTSGEEIVQLIKVALEKEHAVITIDEKKIRPTDAPDIYGSSEALRRDTGWAPKYNLATTIKDCSQ